VLVSHGLLQKARLDALKAEYRINREKAGWVLWIREDGVWDIAATLRRRDDAYSIIIGRLPAPE